MTKSTYCVCGAKSKKKHLMGCARRKSDSPFQYEPVKFKAPPPARQEPRKTNHIVLLIDTSQSMDIYRKLPEKVVNDQINAIKLAAHDNQMNSYLTVVEFDTIPKLKHVHQYVQGFGGYFGYQANGFSTNIFDAFFNAVGQVNNQEGPKLLILITDGEHNTTRGHNALQFAEEVRRLQATDQWTISVIGPSGVTAAMVGYGVPSGNVKVWDGGEQEFNVVSHVTSRAIGDLYQNTYSKGLTSSKSFFEAEVRSAADISRLPLVSGFVQNLVDKSEDISTFVRRVKGSYRPGDALFQLTKPEDVQGFKNVIVQDRVTGELRGGNGSQVRKAIGLPETGDVKVHPGNLKGFIVFVESTSVNRKLVPGTTVLVRR